MLAAGRVYELPTSALRISGNECSSTPSRSGEALLPTIVVADGDGGGGRHNSAGHQRTLPGTIREDILLAESILPTPRATDGTKGAVTPSETTRRRSANGQANLSEEVVSSLLPTPLTTDAKDQGPADANRDTVQLRAIDVLLPTPTTQETHSGPSQSQRNTPPLNAEVLDLLPTPLESEGIKPSNSMGTARRLETGQVFLTNVIVDVVGADPTLPTPTARDHKDTGDFTPHPEKRKIAHTIAAEVGAPGAVDWGKYSAAIARAERVAGRPVPSPTNPDGKHGRHRLSSAFVEWMMLLEAGHVTGRGLTRAQELARLGNGVVPLQAAAATTQNIRDLAAWKRSQIADVEVAS
jgi:DNA (cytosine-5)-methyltransferase 1